MDEKEVVLDRLYDELYRLKDRYAYDPVAVEALEAVQWWAQEESVPADDQQPNYCDGCVHADHCPGLELVCTCDGSYVCKWHSMGG